MRKNFGLMASAVALTLAMTGCKQVPPVEIEPKEDMYLFSYFNRNGDGLHLAYSTDGLKWEALRNDTVWLKPEIGKDKLMRDPSIVQDEEGTFHMVWTSGWWDQGIGYASSKDLITWSPQQEVSVIRTSRAHATHGLRSCSTTRRTRHSTYSGRQPYQEHSLSCQHRIARRA